MNDGPPIYYLDFRCCVAGCEEFAVFRFYSKEERDSSADALTDKNGEWRCHKHEKAASKFRCQKCNGFGVSGYVNHAPSEEAQEPIKCDACAGFGSLPAEREWGLKFKNQEQARAALMILGHAGVWCQPSGDPFPITSTTNPTPSTGTS